MAVNAGDIGTIIEIETGQDLEGATALEIRYRKPDGSVGAWDALPYQTTKAQYTTLEGDIDIAGEWRFQVYAELAEWSGTSTIVSLTVGEAYTPDA
jgi:hypothetical protein